MEFVNAKYEDESLCLQMIEDFYTHENYPVDRKRASKNFREIVSQEDLGKFWLLKNETTTVGYLILTYGYSFEYGGRDAFIDEFYLKEPFRGRGIGTKVLNAIDAEVKNLKVRAIHLEVEKTNEVGIKLYTKAGFKANNRALLTKTLI